jgi:SUN domain-containing protein 1/2
MVPGVCLPLSGAAGFVDIRLRQPIRATAVSLQHIPASIAFDVRSAPRNVAVHGFRGPPGRERPGADAASHSADGSTDSRGFHLASIQYRLAGPPVQTFAVHNSTAVVDHVRIQARKLLQIRT